MLHAGVQSLRVLADDHQVDVAEAAFDPFEGFGGAQIIIEIELLAQRNVDAPESGTDRCGQGSLQGNFGGTDQIDGPFGEGRAGPLVRSQTRLGVDPVDSGAGGIQDAPHRLGYAGSDSVSGNANNLTH